MSYSNPLTITYSWSQHDFGAAADLTHTLVGPSGKIGEIKSILASATEIFTVAGRIDIGSSSAGTQYVGWLVGTLAAASATLAPDSAYTLRALPADTDFFVHFEQTTTTPTGIATVHITVDWY